MIIDEQRREIEALRDRQRADFAGLAMQGLIQSETDYRLDYLERFNNGEENDGDPDFRNNRYCRAVAHDAVKHADALLAALNGGA